MPPFWFEGWRDELAFTSDGWRDKPAVTSNAITLGSAPGSLAHRRWLRAEAPAAWQADLAASERHVDAVQPYYGCVQHRRTS
ncbi:MAG TPA: hypothetical protein VEN79_19130 [Terriglobia bacterium]|nr:hypothetical protein [Terriglobia bacterium]